MNKSNRTPLTDALLPRVRPMALEQRFMFDAAAASTATDPQHTLDAQHTDISTADSLAKFAIAATVSVPVEVRAVDPALNNGRKEVAFIDTGVADYQTLVDGVRAGVEVVLLDAGQDGLAQMALWAQSHSGYDAIHVLSHGSDASIQLGQFQLSNANLNTSQVQSELLSLGQALTVNADLLIYGCDVAQDSNGQAFVNALAAITASDVAASKNNTGTNASGGDWILEYQKGDIEASTLAINKFSGNLIAPYTGVINFDNVGGSVSDAGDTDYSNSGAGDNNVSYSVGGYTLVVAVDQNGILIDNASNLGVGTGNLIATPTGSTGALKTTLSFSNGETFDISTLGLYNVSSDGASNLSYRTYIIKGYNGSNLVGTVEDTADQNNGVVSLKTFNLNFTNVTKVEISLKYDGTYDGINGPLGKTAFFYIEDLSVANVQAYVADTTPPVVSSVNSGTANGAYKVGDTVSIQVNFSEAVTVTGTPQLTLETGTTDRTLNYASGTGTNSLTFTYTVQAGDTTADLDYTSTTALALSGGTIKDAAGNNGVLTLASPGAANSLGANKSIAIDTSAPTVTISTAAFSNDTGTSSNDFVTKTALQTISGTLSANMVSGEIVEVSLDNGSTWTTATTTVGSNSWSLSGRTLSGSNTLKVRVTDTAGNNGTAYSQAYVLDTTAPATTIATKSFSADTGSSNTDFITKTAAQTISGTLSANVASGEVVYVSLDNGATWTAATTTVGVNTWSLSGQTLAASNTLKIKVTDAAGNDGTVSSQAYVLDTTAPTAPSAPDMTSGTDSGASNSDNITSNTTPVFSGTATANSTVTLYDTDGTTVLGTTTSDGSGNWSITSSTLSSASHTITAKVTDTAGNDSIASAGLTITVDTAVPSAIALSSNTLSNSASANTAVGTLSSTDATVGDTFTYALVAGAGSTDNASFAISGSSLQANNPSALSAGSYSVRVRTTDVAGNYFDQTFSITVTSNQAPAVTTPTAIALTDTSSTDTFSNQTGTLSATDADGIASYGIQGGATGGSTVVGAATYDVSKLGTYGTLYVKSSDGSYVYVPNASAINGCLANTSETFTVTATDLNASAATGTATLTVNITGVNDTPTDIGLTATSVSQSGGANATVGTLSTTDADTGDTHTYTLVSGVGDTNNGLFNISGTSLRATNAGSMAPGTYTVRVQTTDAASATYAEAMTITVVDDVAPTVASVAVPTNAWYVAGQNLDFTVNFSESVTVNTTGGTPRMALTVGTTTVYATYLSGSGTSALVFRYTVQANDLDTNGIAVGTLALNGGTLADTTGNNAVLTLNSVGSTTAVLVDAVNPSAPTTPDLALASDSGASNTDNVTSDTTPTLTGTAEAGSTVTLYDTDGTVLGTTTATGGNWSITSTTLSSGSHTITAKVTDAAGNVSSASAGLAITIDAVAPTAVALSTTSLADTVATSGSTLATLSATDTSGLTYSLVAGAGDTHNGRFTITGTDLKAGGSNLAAGTYDIRVRATDAAGNFTDQTFTVTVTSGPSVASINRAGASALTNASSVDYTVTYNESVTGVDVSDFVLTTTGTAGGTIASISGSGTTYTVTVNTLSGDGTLRLDLNNSGTGIVNAGTQAITGGFTSGQTYTLDTTAPTAPSGLDMTAGSDSGISDTDNITSVTTPIITGGGAEAGATVKLYDTDGTTLLGTTTADGAGNWSITSSALSAGSHTLTTKVTDASGNTSAASTGLNVTVDTTAPTAIALSANTVMDVATGTNTAVATLSSTDTQSVSYALAAGDGTNDAGNASFVIAGGTLQSRSQLTAGTYNIRIGATDAAGNISYQTFVITVDTNTAPTITSAATASVAENAATSTVVYTATATDVDAGQTLSYSLTGTDAGSFDIDASTGVVTLKASANYEAKSSYSFNVVVTDNGTGSLTGSKAVAVTVLDVNDPTTGALLVSGDVQQGHTLSVIDTLADQDGINGKTYQWYADGQLIAGANLTTFTPGQDQVGKVITVKASYNDSVGRQEVVTSAGTLGVANTNDPTTGEVSVSGESGVGQTLTASNNLADLDGMGSVTYQWQSKDANGQWQNITLTNGLLATGASYSVKPQQALKELRVKASYTDGQGTAEVIYSTASIKAGGLPPAPVVPVPTTTVMPAVAALAPVEAVKPPVSSFISTTTVNAIPVLSADVAAVNVNAPASSEAPAPTPALSVVSLGVGGSSGTSTLGLRAMEASRDVVMERGDQASYTLPAGTFVHTDGAARVSLTARLADGRPLPDYVKFNPTTGTFTVEAGTGEKAEQLQVIVNAVDDKGQSASTTLVIKLKDKARNSSAVDLPIKLGKLGLSEQIRLADKPAGHLAELAALSKAFAASPAERSRA